MGAVILFTILFVSHVLIFDIEGEFTGELKISTYNLWNVMFNWEVRKLRIAQMIKEVGSEVVALQEVRGDQAFSNQVQELQALLPQFPYHQFWPTHRVHHPKDVHSKTWTWEGIGVLSRHPIVHASVHNISHQGTSTDPIQRVVIETVVTVPGLGDVTLLMTHLTYDKMHQCGNVMELLHRISGISSDAVVLGDFNAYKDFGEPFEVLTSSREYCEQLGWKRGVTKPVLTDAWQQANPGQAGLTFSNMPSPGLESRPDRVYLHGKGLQCISAQTTGDGSTYRRKYFTHIVWNRMENVIKAMHDSWKGQTGRSCVYDCGPHASCRCGVCVSGGDKNACALPDCNECGIDTFFILLIAVFLTLCLIAQCIFALLQLLVTMNERATKKALSGMDQETGIFGNCCLCDPELYKGVSHRIRHYKHTKLFKLYPVLKLPPMILVVVSALMFFVVIEVFLVLLHDALHIVYAIIPEEMHPSDHRMLSIVIAKTNKI